MLEYNEKSITDAVVSSVSKTSNPRMRQITEALVRHLHAFIREVELTESEWEASIAFLTETGQMCTRTRQEFILLSDALGVSTLVDAINHRISGIATRTTVLGPFYVEPPEFGLGADISRYLTGSPMYVSGTVRSIDGLPIESATVDVWHSDHEGFYDLQLLRGKNELAGRGRFKTDTDGAFSLWTVRPAPYPIPCDGPVGKMLAAQGRHPFRPEHIHFMIQALGHAKLVTHVFARGDAFLESDVVFGVKESLIRTFKEHPPGDAPDGRVVSAPWFSLHYDFVLTSESGV